MRFTHFRSTVGLGLTFGLLALAAPVAASPCAGVTLSASQTLGQTYDPAALTAQLVKIRFTSGSRALDCTPYSFTIQPRHNAGQISLQGISGTLPWRAVASGAGAQASASHIELSASARQRLAETGQLELDLMQIEAGQFRYVGDYLAELEWIIDDQPAQPLDVRVMVVPAIRFVGDTVQRLTLGEVSDGGQAQTRFIFATNADLKVTVRSANEGHLQHEQGRSYGRIPYSAVLSGRVLDLNVVSNVEMTGQRLGVNTGQLDVQVEPQSGRFAGTYRDVLTLEFTPY